MKGIALIYYGLVIISGVLCGQLLDSWQRIVVVSIAVTISLTLVRIGVEMMLDPAHREDANARVNPDA